MLSQTLWIKAECINVNDNICIFCAFGIFLPIIKFILDVISHHWDQRIWSHGTLQNYNPSLLSCERQLSVLDLLVSFTVFVLNRGVAYSPLHGSVSSVDGSSGDSPPLKTDRESPQTADSSDEDRQHVNTLTHTIADVQVLLND